MRIEELEIRLKSMKRLRKEADGIQIELKNLGRSLVNRPNLLGDKVKVSKVNGQEDKILKTLERKEKLEKRLFQNIQEQIELSGLVNRLDDPLECLVLRLFYVNLLSTSEIIREVGLSKAAVYRTKKQALENLANLLLAESNETNESGLI